MSGRKVWSDVWSMVKANHLAFAISLILYITFYAFNLAPALITKDIFDRLSASGHATSSTWVVVAFLIVVETSRFVVLYGAGWAFMAFRYASEATVRVNILRRLLLAPGPSTLPGSTGNALSRLRDDVSEVVGLGTILLVGPQVLFGLGSVAIMFAVNAQITLAVIATIFAVTVATALAGRALRIYRQRARQTHAEVASFITETFGAIQAVKLAGAETRLLDRLATLGARRKHASINDSVFSGFLDALNENVVAIGTALVLLLSATAMRDGRFGVGDFVLFISYLAIASRIPLYVGQLVAVRTQASVSSQRLHEFAPRFPAPGDPAPRDERAGEPGAASQALRLLAVRGLTSRHPSSGRGIEGVDLEVEAGTITVVTGRLGSGKTTLLRALLGLTPRQAGSILWNGETIDDPSTWLIPPRCAYTSQSPQLFDGSIRENILLGVDATPDDLNRAVWSAVMERDLETFEAGLDTVVGVRGVRLSGGQLRRVAAARMFVRSPELLVFDDISSALDLRTERDFWTRLASRRSPTCLAVSHRHDAFRAADRIVLMDEGRIVASGDVQALRRTSRLFEELWQAGLPSAEIATST